MAHFLQDGHTCTQKAGLYFCLTYENTVMTEEMLLYIACMYTVITHWRL